MRTHKTPTPQHHDIVVIGTSAGGMAVLTKLVSQLPADLPASIFIVQHLARESNVEILVNRLQMNTQLVCEVAEHEKTFEPGHLYFCPQDHHLLLQRGRMLVTKGPRENLFRPAIDPLFRSAAAAYDSRVIGIILTGMLQDGTVGMQAVKRSGGLTMVQLPAEAEYPDMPQSVMNEMEVDYAVPVGEMGLLVQELVSVPASTDHQVPQDIQYEATIAERLMTQGNGHSEEMGVMGPQVPVTCPDCGGALWEVKNGTLSHLRCHVGHSFTPESYLQGNLEALEETMWVALRMLEERRTMLSSLADQDRKRGSKYWASTQEERAEELKVHIERIRQVLLANANAKNNQQSEDEADAERA
ncbi:chemotaxis protein CheB [Rufibacter quisquiliarum]|uniref:protein-glutamate methylesterase n=1 Tax=Rufibacter quisquiliarum TaxID=1549639 RepID=A0A839GXJ3_9BACT|nr:chemotaxis protein CheB [Rufibacter quisquiliarum]MBA9079158.1 two-component system chemotaxis response regulator CheB [Rufibacter quisquiliarum]